MSPVYSYKHIFWCNCQRSNLDCWGMSWHRLATSCRPMSLAMSGIHWHSSMSSCRRRCQESRGICQARMFVSCCRTSCLQDIGQSRLLCLRWQKAQGSRDIDSHKILLNSQRSSSLGIAFCRSSRCYPRTCFNSQDRSSRIGRSTGPCKSCKHPDIRSYTSYSHPQHILPDFKQDNTLGKSYSHLYPHDRMCIEDKLQYRT